MLIDFAFVGLVLTLSRHNDRSIASVDDSETSQLDNLSEGQKNKFYLVKTFDFKNDGTQIQFITDKLQMICETSSLITLTFYAQNVAIAGTQPTITNTFSCDEVKKDLSRISLITTVADFKKMHEQKVLTLIGSELRASQIYSDEDFPSQWRLAEIKITGPNTFTVNQFEIEKTLMKNFDFGITSAK